MSNSSGYYKNQRSSTSGYYKDQSMISDSYQANAIDDDYFAVWNEFFGNDKTEDESCEHEWEYYQGFSENYEYCIKCDEKREDE